jgi:hypothetical protein
MVELVYNLIFPGWTGTHLQTMSELDDRLISSTRSLSLFELVDEAQVDMNVDLSCNTGQEKHLRKKALTVMMQNVMLTNKKMAVPV